MFNIILLVSLFFINFINVSGLDKSECVSSYGYSSIYNSITDKCSCRDNYQLGKDYKGNTKCISQSQVCKNKYGIMGIYNNSNSKCGCYVGYILVNEQCQYGGSVCNSKIGYGSFYNTNSEKCECKEGFELINGECTSFSQKCVNEIGYGSFYDSNNSICKCNVGYSLINGQCKSGKSHCLSTLGNNSFFDNQSDNCKCTPGYQLVNNKCVSDSDKCINDIGYGSFYDSENSGCLCKVGYKLRNGKCVSNNYYCAGTLGNGSVYKNDIEQCTCKEGYIINNGKCEQGSNHCRNTLGLYSTYNKTKGTCGCTQGYELLDNKCININQECSYKVGAGGEYNSITKECGCEIGYELRNNQCVSLTTECKKQEGPYSYFNSTTKRCGCTLGTKMYEGKCALVKYINDKKLSLFRVKHRDEIHAFNNKLRKRLFIKFDKKSIDQLTKISETIETISLQYIEKNNVNLKSKQNKLIVLISFNSLILEYLNRKQYDENFRSNEITNKKNQQEIKIEEAFEVENDSNSNVSIRKQADDHFKNNNFDKAIILYEKLLSNGVSDFILINNIFVSYVNENKFKEANKIIFYIYNIVDEKDTVTGYTIIEGNLSQKIYDKSIEYRNIKKDDDINIIIEYAELLYKAGDYYYEDDKVKNYLAIMSTYITAYVILDKALLDEPNNDKILFLQGRLLMDINGNFELAQSKLEKAIEVNQEDFNYYYRLGNALNHQKKYKEAKNQYIKGIELEKNYEKLYLNLGNSYFDLNEDEKGFLTYEIGINICKTHCDGFYHNMGNQYYHNDDYENARIWYKKVSIKHPSYETDNNIIELIKDK